MEHAYGIGTSNRYGAFLSDDADDILDREPAPIDPKVTKEKKKKKSGSAGNQNKQLNEKNSQKPVETDTRSNRRDDIKDKPERFGKEADVPPRRGGRGGRGGRGNNRRGGRPYQDRENRENEEPTPYNNESTTTEMKPERSFTDRPRGFGQPPRGEFGERRGRGGRGRGGRGRGSGSNGGRDYRGKREFDRHSGSDKSSIKPHEKREGNGPHNWGSVRDEVSELDTSNVTDEGQEWNAQVEDGEPTTVQKDGETQDEEKTTEGIEDDTVEMTLEEYKAQINQNRYKKDFNLRKAKKKKVPTATLR